MDIKEYTEPTFCTDCHEPTSLCQCGEPVARPSYSELAARLAEAGREIARLLEITDTCEWCGPDARATDSASVTVSEVTK
jgi:hypothetical protein